MVTEKLSPNRFAAFNRSYAEFSREIVRLTISLHIYRHIYVDYTGTRSSIDLGLEGVDPTGTPACPNS